LRDYYIDVYVSHAENLRALLVTHTFDFKTCSSCVYTNPEIAAVGLTEKQASELGLEYIAILFFHPFFRKRTEMIKYTKDQPTVVILRFLKMIKFFAGNWQKRLNKSGNKDLFRKDDYG
jgi:hypothetical protein